VFSLTGHAKCLGVTSLILFTSCLFFISLLYYYGCIDLCWCIGTDSIARTDDLFCFLAANVAQLPVRSHSAALVMSLYRYVCLIVRTTSSCLWYQTYLQLMAMRNQFHMDRNTLNRPFDKLCLCPDHDLALIACQRLAQCPGNTKPRWRTNALVYHSPVNGHPLNKIS
jgi:hypothetical protein